MRASEGVAAKRQARQPMSKQEHFGLGRIAKMCNVSRTTVYRWIINGHLTAYTLPSGHFRVRPEDLSQFCRNFGIPDPQGEAVVVVPTRAESLKVLIADDHPDMLLVLHKVVERFLPTATIFESSNGVDTCIAVATKQPDLLLLDIMMPGMDGFAVLQELLRRPELERSQVVVVTAYDPFERVQELERIYDRVAACVRKPIAVEELGNLLREIAQSLAARSR
jgi:excisionase family DNA binding protein